MLPSQLSPPCVVDDCLGVLRVYSDGAVLRLSSPSFPVPVADDSSVIWKDVIFFPEHGLHLRLYKPRLAGAGGSPPASQKLPVFFYFHCGGWPNCQNYCLRLASELGALIVSPDYRLAPEHRLPAALDDAIAALLWLRSQAAGGDADPWLADHADFDRIFVSGDSAGGNLAHHLAVRFASASGRSDLVPVRIRGFILLMPFFGGTAPTWSEAECPQYAFLSRELSDRFWRLSMPTGSTLDHPLINPLGPDNRILDLVQFDPTMVVVGERGLLRDRAAEYATRLRKLGKPIELNSKDSITASSRSTRKPSRRTGSWRFLSGLWRVTAIHMEVEHVHIRLLSL